MNTLQSDLKKLLVQSCAIYTRKYNNKMISVMFASCHMDTHPGECHIRVGVDSVDSENISTRSHPLMLDYYKLFYK